MSTWERLTRTKIYRALREREGEGSRRNQDTISLVNSVNKIVKDTDILLTRVQDNFPEYTLHDTTHSVKIVELMDKIIPNETLRSLNNLELSILILSAYLHDIGMVKPREETRRILRSREFIEFREENTDISQSIEDATKIGNNRTAIELEDALITEFVRKKHGKRTYEYILENHTDNRLLEYCGVNFAEDLALICASHCFDTYDLAERKKEADKLMEVFRRDKMIHNKEINIQYLAVSLRLADIMDFDRERTPKILFKYISPKSKISLKEWMKHLSITGWRINRNEIRYEAQCTHPVYQNALYKFIDQIDAELERCNYLIKDNKEEITGKYRLNLPIKVNRNYVLSKGFYYGPFKFSLDYERIITLLMGQQLYDEKSISIRELLQNSIDACRHRRAFEKMNNRKGYRPKIKFIHEKKDGYDIIEVEDNGIGMDMNTIQNYFMKIGVSYYRSREFDKERMEFKKRGFDFDPISRLGIGILSCFMIADRVVTETYRARSLPTEKSQPLRIEIEGPSQFFVARNGKRNTYGTKVTLFLKKDHGVDLIEILKKYARHVEFPISVKPEQTLKATEIKDEGFETEPISSPELKEKISKIEIDLSKNNKFKGIKGRLSLYFLKDSTGKLCFAADKIVISGTEFRTRIDERIMLDIFSRFIPSMGEEEISRYFSERYGREVKIDDIPPEDFMWDLLRHIEYEHHLRYRPWEIRRRSRYPDVMRFLGEGIRESIDRFSRISDLMDGLFSCDGILVSLPWAALDLSIPHKFDIDVIGDDKPNLRVARDKVADDEELEIFRNKIKTIIADVLYEQFLNEKISNIPEQRYAFITRLCRSEENIPIFKELLKKDVFRMDMLLIKVQKESKEIFSSLLDIVKDFSGKIYLLDYEHGTELPKYLKEKPFIDKSEDFLIDLIANSSGLTFFTNGKRDKCYFELLLRNIDDIQHDKELFTFAKYSGKYKEMLFCKNRLKALNLNHTISRIYFRFKKRSGALNKEMIVIFKRLLKEITGLWEMNEENFGKIDNIVKEIKRKASSLDYLSSKDLDEITINTKDFHFW